jgi:hypothetical protein
MRQAGAEVVGLMRQKHLGFVFHATKGSRVDDSIPVALKSRAQGMFLQGILTPSGLCGQSGKAGQILPLS